MINCGCWSAYSKTPGSVLNRHNLQKWVSFQSASTDANKKSDAATTAADSVAASTAIDATAATAADSVNSDAAATTADAIAVTTTATDTTTTDTTAADLAHAQQATASFLERVAQTANAEANVASDDETYEVLIRFTQKPSDNTWWDLVEEIDNLVDKYNFEVDITETRPPFATTAPIESQA